MAKNERLRRRNERLLKRVAAPELIKAKGTTRSRDAKGLRAALFEAEQQQAATSEILRVISSSPTDVQPVFDAIAHSAARLFDVRTTLILARGDRLEIGAMAGYDEKSVRQLHEVFPRPIDRETTAGRTVLDRAGQHIPDVDAPEIPEVLRRTSHATGVRALLSAPMLREGAAIGAILLTRATPGLFSEKQAALLQTFARQAVIAIENVRLFNETKESLEQQTASSEILRVIAGSPADVQPVFDTIARNTSRLCNGMYTIVTRFDGKLIHLAAEHNPRLGASAPTARQFPRSPGRDMPSPRAVLERAVVHIPDVEKDFELARELVRGIGAGSFLAVPMLRDGVPIGAIGVSRAETGPFPASQIELLKVFADQAVIAIENVRLFSETKEALEQQTAISEVLRVISDSPTDVKPVLDAVAARAARICEAFDAIIFLREGEQIRHVAHFGDIPPGAGLGVGKSVRLGRDMAAGRAILDGTSVHIEDMTALLPEEWGRALELQKSSKHRTMLAVPLMREGRALGAINLRRMEVRPFSEKQIALVKTFADQAAIAIENVRLFNETREALERQTATSDILRVISRTTTDTQPVFEAIVESGLRVLPDTTLAIAVVEQDAVRVVATGGYLRGALGLTVPPGRESATGTAIADRRLVHLPDIEAPDVPPLARENGRRLGYRSMAVAPMLREDRVIGAVAVMLKSTGGLSEKQLNLLKTFADQAVIAIENVRLFNETKEALDQQKASAEVLGAISASIADTRPVFDKILESCARLFEGQQVGIIVVGEDGVARLAAYNGPQELRKGYPHPVDRTSATGLAMSEQRVLHYPDIAGGADIPEVLRRNAALTGTRSLMIAPMLREGHGVGAVFVGRSFAGAFSEKAMRLLKTFADQAVIAIENVRLFKELQERTEALSKSVSQLTALGEVGQAISSTLELETVLKTIVSRAVQLTGLDAGAIYEYDEGAEEFHLRAAQNLSEDVLEILRSRPIKKGDGAVGGTAVVREPIQIPETQDESYKSGLRDLIIRAGRRALLAVPLMREDHIIGALAVQRNTPGPFAPEVVELLKTFATQSAMAIQNARLFREIAEKSRQLEVASRHKSQFLASMSHELRTPLNAILGFNEMVIDEIYGPVPEGMKSPLENIQSSGKHLLRLINNVLDLAKIEAGRMELALSDYSVQDTVSSVHSTLRPLAAEKGLEFVADVSPDIPPAHGDAGRLAQCLMNLAGNSLKFTRQGRVAIAVAQRDGLLHFSVADTGIGIPPEKIANLFTEFKQTDATIASEYGGTGLGLSITKKFIEMHGGRIWVESEPGKGSNFLFEIPLRVGR